MHKKVFLIIFFFLTLSQEVSAKLVVGVGYIYPSEYRVDNKVSPLPLGWNIVPMLGYRGDRLSIIGPKIRYKLIKHRLLNFYLGVEALGDRYESEGIGLRDTSLNGTVGVRILFLSAKYGQDISGRYRGKTFEVSAGWRFFLTDRIFIVPSYKRRYLDSRYVNFYYGITEGEAQSSPYSYYQTLHAVNELITITSNYKITERQSIVLTGRYTLLHHNIYNSPTTSTKSYLTASLFWNISF